MATKTLRDLRLLGFLAVVSLVVFTSGCTAPGSSGGISYGKGVIIQGFESDMGSLSVESGDEISLMLKVQNQGELDALNVEAKIIGIDLDEWGTGFAWSDDKNLGDLHPPDPITKTEGQSKTTQWNLEAPELPTGTEFSYEPRVRVFYDYETKAVKPITLVDVDELKTIIQQGKTLSGEATRSSAGPMTIEIRTGDFVKTQNYDDPFPLNVFITNDLWETGGSVTEGSGYYGGWGFDKFQYPVKVTLTLPSGMSLVSSEGCSTSGEWVNLWKGKSAEITCEVRITDPPEYRQEKVIQAKVEYRYYLDALTTINVIGTEEDWRF
jgi:hypothetical protein